jgi:hypothetical protein
MRQRGPHVPPIHVMFGLDDEHDIWVTPDRAYSADLVREWWRGRARLPVLTLMDIDPRLYESFVPASEYGQKEADHEQR